MRLLDPGMPISSPAFRGEPGEASQDAVGGWSAADSREYCEFALREELRQFAELYGWDALTEQVRTAQVEGAS